MLPLQKVAFMRVCSQNKQGHLSTVKHNFRKGKQEMSQTHVRLSQCTPKFKDRFVAAKNAPTVARLVFSLVLEVKMTIVVIIARL